MKLIVSGLKEPVSQGVFHRDLKPENFVLHFKFLSTHERFGKNKQVFEDFLKGFDFLNDQDNFELKLIDFGLVAITTSDKVTN